MKNKIILIIISIVGVLTLSIISVTILLNTNKKNIKEESTTTSTEETTTIETTTETTTIEVTTTTEATTTTHNTTNKVSTIKQTTKATTKAASSSNVITETREERKPAKYNVTQIITYTDTYRIYDDGRKELISSKQKSSKYDYSTYSATTAELKTEASSIAASNISAYQEMLGYVNQLRANEGVSALTLDSNLNLAATVRALEMAWSGKFSHTRPNGQDCFSVYSDLGIRSSAKGENIAGYNANVKSTFEQWNNSPDHHANMVKPEFTKIGVGKYTLNGRSYWVQLFGR